jgi:hypothetical protein
MLALYVLQGKVPRLNGSILYGDLTDETRNTWEGLITLLNRNKLKVYTLNAWLSFAY